MKPSEPPLPKLLNALVAANDSLHVAYGHNYLFEERVAVSRQRAYESSLELPSVDLKAWKNRHKGYLSRRIYVGIGQVAETFTSDNADALVADLAEKQWIIRLENVDRVLVHLRTDLSMVDAQLSVFRQGEDQEATTLARQFLDNFCEEWNTAVRRDHRPSFAAFFGDLKEDIEATDWPNRLRDRLGLSHYEVRKEDPQPLPVALLRYRVEDVLAADTGDPSASFAVPTVLDGELNTHFFPAPREVGYGRTLDLKPDEECERLVAEVLHRRIEYRPEHMLKLGWITSPLPPFQNGPAFARLRNGHLFCLRYESVRNDFGANIPGGEHG